MESLAIFSQDTEPRYVDSREIRQGDNVFPIQFPEPIKYDQSNAIRYQTIDRYSMMASLNVVLRLSQYI